MKTDNNTLTASQNAAGIYITEAFHSGNGPLIMLRQVTPGKVKYKLNWQIYYVLKAASTCNSLSDADTFHWL